ncbi:acyl-CoA thioesterase [Streptomyces sp. NPDC051976]|uniref:acyl-CoA thioesterase n=1 Tax=Streptomyces sp. NPDC051976 TaxID=3154947 RepID=UPI003432B30E
MTSAPLEPFSVSVTARGYETDSQGHVNTAVYMQYAEHARWSLCQAAGIEQADLLAAGVGPVNLETTMRFRRELRAGQEVLVGCAFVWGEGKTFKVVQELRLADGTLVAEVDSVGGLMDLKERRLVPDPRESFRTLASDAALLGL